MCIVGGMHTEKGGKQVTTLAASLLKTNNCVVLHFPITPVFLFHPSARTLLAKAKVTLVTKSALGGRDQALTHVSLEVTQQSPAQTCISTNNSDHPS